MIGVENLLKRNGFVKMPWNKCPKGYEQSDYRCYSHEAKNIWVELYLSDPAPYGWIISPKINTKGPVGGKTFETKTQLELLLKP